MRRQLIEHALQTTKLVAGAQLRFQILPGLQQLYLGNGFEGDDPLAAGEVDNQVARDGVEILATALNVLPVGIGIGAGKNLRHQIVQIVRVARQSPQSRP